MKVRARILDFVQQWHGRTQREIAQGLYGEKLGRQQRVNPYCALMVAAGEIVQRGAGGPGDPYRYFPVSH
jgi:hypothetical protein